MNHSVDGSCKYLTSDYLIHSQNSLFFNRICVGHGGSDGLHGYVPSLDAVVADTVS